MENLHKFTDKHRGIKRVVTKRVVTPRKANAVLYTLFIKNMLLKKEMEGNDGGKKRRKDKRKNRRRGRGGK